MGSLLLRLDHGYRRGSHILPYAFLTHGFPRLLEGGCERVLRLERHGGNTGRGSAQG